MAQTGVQNLVTVRFGSAKFEVGDTVGALVDVGAIRNGVFEHSFTPVKIKSDNAGYVRQGIRDEEAALGGDLMEINLENLSKFYKGVFTHATVAAAGVTVSNEAQTLTGTTENVLTKRNGDKTVVTSVTVTDVAGTTTYVADCDYVLGVNAAGYTTIQRAAGKTICSGLADVTIATPGKTYTTAGGAFTAGLAVGDHITVSGCVETGNNGVKTVTAVSGTVITVNETCTAETPGVGQAVVITRGGIATGGIVHVDYTYTPLSSRTLKSGGLTTLTAQVCRFTNTNAAGKIFRITVYSTTPDAGIKINFVPDDADDVSVCPIRMLGVLDSARTAGDQLFEIYDEQHAV